MGRLGMYYVFVWFQFQRYKEKCFIFSESNALGSVLIVSKFQFPSKMWLFIKIVHWRQQQQQQQQQKQQQQQRQQQKINDYNGKAVKW